MRIHIHSHSKNAFRIFNGRRPLGLNLLAQAIPNSFIDDLQPNDNHKQIHTHTHTLEYIDLYACQLKKKTAQRPLV